MSSPGALIATGAVKGTGAAIEVRTPGFRPKFVRLWNADGDRGEWIDVLADASFFKFIDTTGVCTLETTGGITPAAGGFDIGADAALNQDGVVIYWIAFGS